MRVCGERERERGWERKTRETQKEIERGRETNREKQIGKDRERERERGERRESFKKIMVSACYYEF